MNSYLILGGTGTTGRRIADRLRSTGHEVRTAARTGADVHIDLDAPSTWEFGNATAVYLLEPTVRTGGRLARFAEAALASGVRRLVLLSASRASDPAHPLHTTEQVLRNSSAEWTILHPDWFAQNFSEGTWRTAVEAGTLALPAGTGRTPFIDADDIADVATAALTTDGHHGRTYQLTGPEAITFAEAAMHISNAGRPVEYVAIEPAVYTEQLVAHGVPRAGAELLTSILVGIADGHAGQPATDVLHVLGRPARSFKAFATDANWS